MFSKRKLNQRQKIGFLREGYLVIQGDFSAEMIADLLAVLETNEESSGEESPSGGMSTGVDYPA